MWTASQQLLEIRKATGFSQERLAHHLGVSFVSVNRWEREATTPSPAQAAKIKKLHDAVLDGESPGVSVSSAFASHGVRQASAPASSTAIDLAAEPGPPILNRIARDEHFVPDGAAAVKEALARRASPAKVSEARPPAGMSAGKNTYTYDAHTYHTKVPPQGIAELLRHYLPESGLVLDLFGGSGMTGVAAATLGLDCILVELSPAACFISREFTRTVDAAQYSAAVAAVVDACSEIRERLYRTMCRECGASTELLYVVWSYRVICSHCDVEFQLWDHCRSYGRTVREHRILSRFDCPACRREVVKSKLQRTVAEPVQVAYQCCGSRQREVGHPPDETDLQLIAAIEANPPLVEGYYPVDELPEGVNLGQPRRHGLNRVDKFYTTRNLAALSHIWETIHRIDDVELAAMVAFTFTSLYRRVTKFSEFRFWGGSGNTARLNVPFIFDEPNVFRSFTRKARTIQDHLETTAQHYSSSPIVVNTSATDLSFLPNESVDLVFTDPPFGANINYSEMNFLWESWLGRFTHPGPEAIINRIQGKSVIEYEQLMLEALREAQRVLRKGGWLLLAFMNSSASVWTAIVSALEDGGFAILGADIFDKQHGTFKHFVSKNCAGSDLILHCRKRERAQLSLPIPAEAASDLESFLSQRNGALSKEVFLHVDRDAEVDFRRLYSEWLSESLPQGLPVVDFVEFRRRTIQHLGLAIC
jgi:DNA modification methylase/transcriptional regulator with XRE-family HTH domain